MRNENEISPAPHSDRLRQDIDQCSAEIAQMRESVELTRSDVRRTKNELEVQRGQRESHVRRTRVLWAIVILLVVSLGGLAWFGGPLLDEHRGLLGKMPALQSALDNANSRLGSAEEQISAWATDRAGWTDRMAKFDQALRSNVNTVRNETRMWAQQLRSDMGQSLRSLESRVGGVESTQREGHEVVARLQDELEGVRRELASVKEENDRRIEQVAQAFNQSQQTLVQSQQATRNDVSGLDRRVNSNQSAVRALAYQVDRQRIDFELPNGSTQQIVAGIYVTVKHADVEKQRVEGWVQIAGDGRFVWLRGESAQTPIQFSSQADARSYDLVFTRIGRNSTVGYVLAPVPPTNSAAGN